MSTSDEVTELEVILAPWGRELTLSNQSFESGMQSLRFRIRENKRFTDLDLDPDTADKLAEVLSAWAKDAREKMG